MRSIEWISDDVHMIQCVVDLVILCYLLHFYFLMFPLTAK